MYSSYFYKDIVYKTIINKTKTDTGKLILGYKKDISIECDIQPIEAKAIKNNWGIDIDAQYQVYSDYIFDINDIIVWNDKTYQVIKNIDWIDYSVIAIKLVDLKVIP